MKTHHATSQTRAMQRHKHKNSAAEEEAAKAAAAEAKKAREAEKQVMKKQRQLLRKLADGGEGQQRLLSLGVCGVRMCVFLSFFVYVCVCVFLFMLL